MPAAGEGSVPVSLNFRVADFGLVTKAGEDDVADPDLDEDYTAASLIHNFWVLQFDGTGDDAKMLVEPKYYASYETFIAPVEEGGHGGVMKLTPSEKDVTIFILANSFDPLFVFRRGSTIADLKQIRERVTDDTCFLAKDMAGNMYPVLSAFWTGKVAVPAGSGEPEQSMSFELKRNVARLDITILNTSTDVTVTSWQLKSLPEISYLTTNYSLPSTFPIMSDFGVMDFPVYPASEDLHYRAYVPVNMRGSVVNPEGQKFKNAYAPKNATYIVINASYKNNRGEDNPISYTFYLGADLESDFNLKPNCAYEYVFEIRSKGDAVSDMRIKDMGPVDFATPDAELANCYILNPAQTEDSERIYRIPVAKVNTFWQEYEGNTEGSSSYVLNDNTRWKVSLLVYNFDNSGDKVRLTKNEGTGVYDSNGQYEYFEVAVKGNVKGNAIVAIYPYYPDGSPVPDVALWSWHLWITEYSPDEALSRTPKPGEYRYPVTGGAVHRYEGAEWTSPTGLYANSFIMDRNLGAPNTEYNKTGNNSGSGVLYYQFGRKDPIFGTKPTRGDFTAASNADAAFAVIELTNDEGLANAVRSSVMYPLKFFRQTGDTRKTWTQGNQYNPTTSDSRNSTILWHDPQTARGASNEGGKSIFDPCPPGYCVPQASLWADFRKNDASSPTTNARPSGNMLRGFPAYKETSNYGSYYWPYVEPYLNQIPESPVYYPSSGYVEKGGVSSLETYLYSVSSNPNGANGMIAFVHRCDNQSLGTEGFQRALGFPVRCVSYDNKNR